MRYVEGYYCVPSVAEVEGVTGPSEKWLMWGIAHFDAQRWKNSGGTTLDHHSAIVCGGAVTVKAVTIRSARCTAERPIWTLNDKQREFIKRRIYTF